MPNRPTPDSRRLRNGGTSKSHPSSAVSSGSTRPKLSHDVAGGTADIDTGASMVHDLDEEGAQNPPRPPRDFFDTRHSARVAYQTVLGMVQGFATTICIARSLAAGEREMDLSGLHEAAGILCARALDLRPEHGRQLVPRLQSVLEELDALHTVLAPAHICSGAERD